MRVAAILESQTAAMRFKNLPRQHKADAGATGFGREERHEKVFRVRQAAARIDDFNAQFTVVALPADAYFAAVRQGRVNRILEQIDQRLLDLVRIGIDIDSGTGFDHDRHALLKMGDALDQLGEAKRLGFGGGKRANAV